MKINDRIERKLKECVADDIELFDLLSDIQVTLNAYRFIIERKITHNKAEMSALESWAPGVHKIILEDGASLHASPLQQGE